MTAAEQSAESDAIGTLRRAAAQIRNDRGGCVSKHTQDGQRWLPVADWLDAYATRLETLGHAIGSNLGEAVAVARAYLGEEPTDA